MIATALRVGRQIQFGRSTLVDASPLLRYGVASAFLLAATLMRIGMALIVNRPLSAPLFLAAIMLSTWLGGLRLGVFASVVAAATLDYFFAQPITGVLELRDHLLRFFLFSVEGALLSWLINKLRLASEEIIVSREELRELAEQQRLIRETEQKRIAREIHDELGQALTGLKLRIHLLKGRAGAKDIDQPDPALDGQLEEFAKEIDVTIGTVRRIATELRPSVLDDFGLVAAIEWQTNDFAERSGIDCMFRSNVDEIDIDPDASTGVFRILQEALTNILRHADATQVRVNFARHNDEIELTIEDNGRGIAPKASKQHRSLGLLGMKERTRLLGGEITFSTPKGGGTLVKLRVPVPNLAAVVPEERS